MKKYRRLCARYGVTKDGKIVKRTEARTEGNEFKSTETRVDITLVDTQGGVTMMTRRGFQVRVADQHSAV